MGLNIGKYKTWLNRLQGYMSPLNFVMVLYLYIIAEPLRISWPVWVVIVVVSLLVLLLVDMVFIFPSELVYSSLKNPEWVEARKDIEEIKTMIGQLLEKQK